MSDADDELDPELEGAIERIRAGGVPPWHSLSVESARRIEDEVFSAGEGPGMETVRDVAVDGPGGDLPIRAYRPDVDDPGTLVFYHGGGWTLGTLDSADDLCRELAARGGCLVLSVDYRLAPEHPFPAAVMDALAALEWASEHAGALGGDPDRLGVAGTSAGGNLAAATALAVREGAESRRAGRGEAGRGGAGSGGADRQDRWPDVDLAGQFLLYPILDRSLETDSYREHAGAPLLSRADMEWFWERYLRSPVDAHNPFACPLRTPDLEGVAPATVVSAGHDVLRDEAAAYADRLTEAGVPTEHDRYSALAHGFLSLTDDVERADEAMDRLAGRIRTRLA